MEVLKATLEEKMKTAFNRIEEIEKSQKEFMKDTNKEIASLKLQVMGLEGIFKEELNTALKTVRDDIHDIMTSTERKENEELKGKVDKYFKWVFWLITAVLGTVITIFITSFLNSR